MSSWEISTELNELIKAIYQGPLEDELWSSFLQQYRELMGASYATLLLRPPSPGDDGIVLNAIRHSSEVFMAYNQTYFSLDSFVDLPTGKVVTLDEFIGAEAFLQSAYYQKFLKPLGVRHILGADLTQGGAFNARLRVTRDDDQAEFNEQEKQLTQLILPHLEQAILLHAKLAQTEMHKLVYADAIEHLAMGCFILDEQTKVLHMNDAAQRFLAEKQGLRLASQRLQVGDRNQNLAFRELLDEVLQAHKNQQPSMVKAFRFSPSGFDNDLGLLVRPLPVVNSSETNDNPCVAIFISDPHSRRQASAPVLAQLFGFTPAEAQLALLLANGCSLDEAASELGVTRNTAKSHLSSIFSKTGVTRQPKLVQLILKSVAPIG